MRYVIVVFLCLTFGLNHTYGQTVSQSKVFSKLQSFLFSTDLEARTPDSSMVIAVAFLIELEKNGQGKASVRSVTVTDSSGYTLYPNFDYLRTVDYRAFMESRKKATLVLPIVVEMVGSQGKRPEFKTIDLPNFFKYGGGKDLSEFIVLPPSVWLFSRVVMN